MILSRHSLSFPICTSGRCAQSPSEAPVSGPPLGPWGSLGAGSGYIWRGKGIPGVPVPTSHRAVEDEALGWGVHPLGKDGVHEPHGAPGRFSHTLPCVLMPGGPGGVRGEWPPADASQQ